MDESKERGLLLAVAVVLPAELAPARKALRGLILPQQRRIHFHKERDDRRRRIVHTIAATGAHAVIFDAGRHRGMKAARDACLSGLVDHAAKIGAARLVLERDESVLKADQRQV